jgi:DNA-binding transcriptional LysR family regulator
VRQQGRARPRVITALVAAGAGVAVVPSLALPAVTDGLSLHPLTRPVTREVSVLTAVRQARGPHLGRVLDSLRAAAALVAD